MTDPFADAATGWRTVIERIITGQTQVDLHSSSTIGGVQISSDPHTVDSNAATKCNSNELLTGDDTCIPIPTGNPGTVTSVDTGTGLTGGPITSSGTISVATDGITSTQILDGTITAADIATNAIGTNEIKPGGVGVADIALNEVQSRVSDSCPPGQSIRAIDSGGSVTCEIDSGSNLSHQIVSASPAFAMGTSTNSVSCPSGKVVVGGGFSDVASSSHVVSSKPTSSSTGWEVKILNTGIGSDTVMIFAICLDPTP